MGKSLTSIPTLVESPFIIATLGGITFGTYTKENKNNSVTFPNFMKSVSINKVNGTVNTYTLNFSYQVRLGDDPNLMDKILSKAANDRLVILQYGDWSAPSYIYKEEKCIITNVSTSLNMQNACIDYTVKCTSSALLLTANTFSFPAIFEQPSKLLLKLSNSKKYGFYDVFSGMHNQQKTLQNNLIATNDRKVQLLPQANVSTFDYMNYLVDSMVPYSNANMSDLSNSKYYLTIHDDYTNTLGGTYFKVNEVNKNVKQINSTNTYEVDVNYPGDNFVTQFSLNNDQAWSILYEYSGDLKQESYSYSINNDGTLQTKYVPNLFKSVYSRDISPAKNAWWAKMTQFPIKATLTIKGLARPSILMTHVKVNVWFNGGVKHISSGLYVITKQTDYIDSAGYKTTLELLRIDGD